MLGARRSELILAPQAIYPASLDMHSYNFLMQEVPFETR